MAAKMIPDQRCYKRFHLPKLNFKFFSCSVQSDRGWIQSHLVQGIKSYQSEILHSLAFYRYCLFPNSLLFNLLFFMHNFLQMAGNPMGMRMTLTPDIIIFSSHYR